MSDKPVRVMLVDDDRDDYALTRDLFAEMPGRFKLSWAADFDAGLEAMAHGDHDVYLVDYRLGKHDGLELLRAAIKRGLKAPIVMLTGQEADGLDEAALEAGAADYLVKGQIDANVLARVIRYALKQKADEALLESRVEERTLELARANRALQESEQRYRQMIQGLPAAVYTTDAEGRIMLYNEAAAELWGRAPEIGRDQWCGSLRIWTPDGRELPLDQCPMALAVKEGLSTRGAEIIVERPDGTRRRVVANPEPLRNESGQITGAINMLIDVTEQYRIQDELRVADQRKDEFLAMLAHELRNPLAPLSNSLDLLWLSDELSPGVEQVCKIMERQVKHMVRLVDDLLEVSRITRGKVQLRKEPVDLASIIRNAVETSRPLIAASEHQLALSVAAEPITLEADPVRLAQVVSNLLNNAAKYTERGGQIVLHARREGSEAVISVRDNGVGIPAEMLPHVFDLFAQVDRSLSRSQGGLGIGLTLAKSMVQMHGGSVEGRSEGAGKGSEFLIRLPLAHPSAHPVIEQSPTAARARPAAQRILVVDDTRASAYILSQLLTKMGQEVRTNDNAAEALESIRRDPPDMVISDIAMPGMDGYELARSLRDLPGRDKVLLVALTGYGQDGDRQRARDAGFDHHLIKPVSIEALAALLESAPSRRTSARV